MSYRRANSTMNVSNFYHFLQFLPGGVDHSSTTPLFHYQRGMNHINPSKQNTLFILDSLMQSITVSTKQPFISFQIHLAAPLFVNTRTIFKKKTFFVADFRCFCVRRKLSYQWQNLPSGDVRTIVVSIQTHGFYWAWHSLEATTATLNSSDTLSQTDVILGHFMMPFITNALSEVHTCAVTWLTNIISEISKQNKPKTSFPFARISAHPSDLLGLTCWKLAVRSRRLSIWANSRIYCWRCALPVLKQ